MLFLPDELLPVEPDEAAAEAAEAKGVVKAAAPMDLTSLLLHDPAEMSLAGPVAEVNDIFSSSNSAGPAMVKKCNSLIYYDDVVHLKGF